MTEIFKVKTGIAPELMKDVFELADVPYNLWNQSKYSRSIPSAEKYGIETAPSIGLKLWDKVATEIKINNDNNNNNNNNSNSSNNDNEYIDNNNNSYKNMRVYVKLSRTLL